MAPVLILRSFGTASRLKDDGPFFYIIIEMYNIQIVIVSNLDTSENPHCCCATEPEFPQWKFLK